MEIAFLNRKCSKAQGNIKFLLLFVFVYLIRSNNGSLKNQQFRYSCDKTRVILSDLNGEISSGTNYTQETHCEWLIKAENASQFIQLNFITMETVKLHPGYKKKQYIKVIYLFAGMFL